MEARMTISRRKLLKTGAVAAVTSGAAAVVGERTARAGQAPAVLSNAQAGRPFRAYVGSAANGAIEDLRLLPLGDKHVLVRTQASAPCYTMVLNGIGGTPSVSPDQLPNRGRGGAPGAGGANRPRFPPGIANHTFTGVVEAVGTSVKRVQPGDRVVVGVTSYCGQCYQCLRGRADMCQFTVAFTSFPPIARRADGTTIGAQLGIGGLSELNVVLEEYTCPVFTELSPAELSLLGDTAATGIASAMCLFEVEPGSDVVVLGAGAIGSSAIQGARVMGAGQIIAVEPIKHRRDLALKLGATTVLDPNAEGDGLVEKIRSLCKGPTDRLYAGGRGWDTVRRVDNRGADFTIEAVGRCGDKPKVEQPPDPTGILPMQQAWQFTRRGGSLVYLGFGQVGNVSYPASAFANNGRNVFAGQQGGLNMMRDLPRFVRLMERGLVDLKPIITSTWKLDDLKSAFQVLSDRTEMCPVVLFS
jgi:S-(hydroxymethyl)glutathione dehydrogenase/alcohol dehydrogenase